MLDTCIFLTNIKYKRFLVLLDVQGDRNSLGIYLSDLSGGAPVG
jgi:hypothetical protein